MTKMQKHTYCAV